MESRIFPTFHYTQKMQKNNLYVIMSFSIEFFHQTGCQSMKTALRCLLNTLGTNIYT